MRFPTPTVAVCRWLSSLKATAAGDGAVVQAFHVSYWDYIGWIER